MFLVHVSAFSLVFSFKIIGRFKKMVIFLWLSPKPNFFDLKNLKKLKKLKNCFSKILEIGIPDFGISGSRLREKSWKQFFNRKTLFLVTVTGNSLFFWCRKAIRFKKLMVFLWLSPKSSFFDLKDLKKLKN